MYAGRVRYPGFPPDAWDPFYPFPAIQAEASAEAGFGWGETVEAHVLTARMPGAKKEGVKVEVEAGGMLKISGEKLLRRFRLPEVGRVAEITAVMGKDGVLTVTVPKVGAYYKVIPIV